MDQQAADKAKKAAEKAQRKAEFEAKRAQEAKQKPASCAGPGNAEKSKADLKAERRAKQEAQRAAKAGDKPASAAQPAAQKAAQPAQKPVQAQKDVSQKQNGVDGQLKAATKGLQNLTLDGEKKTPEKEVSRSSGNMFAHLPSRPASLASINIANIPAVMVNVGSEMNRNAYKGSTADCLALCTAFRRIVNDYEYLESSKNDLVHDLQKLLFADCVRFLAKCCPLSIAMDNALKYLKVNWTKLEQSRDNQQMKENIDEMIKSFIEQEIIKPMDLVSKNIQSKINSGDTIMTLGYSRTIKNALVAGWKGGKQFHVIVVDTRPRFEGKSMVEELTQAGIPTTYCLISSISYVMTNVNRVFVEAHALMGNGYVMAHSGAAQIALVAKAFNVQFLVCCEQFKFSDRVHTDSFGHNELGNEKEFFSSLPPGKHGRPRAVHCCSENLHVMDMIYDLTPHELVTTIITEKSLMPAISVPIILRIRETQ